MKGIFDDYVLWPFGKNIIFELVIRVRTHNFTVNKIGSGPSSFTTEVMLKQAFSEMDRDNDGRVTEDEFVSATLGHEKVATLLTMKIVNCLVQPWKIYNL